MQYILRDNKLQYRNANTGYPSYFTQFATIAEVLHGDAARPLVQNCKTRWCLYIRIKFGKRGRIQLWTHIFPYTVGRRKCENENGSGLLDPADELKLQQNVFTVAMLWLISRNSLLYPEKRNVI